MGYRLSVSIYAKKAHDWAALSGVHLLVYLQGEAYSIDAADVDSEGHASLTIERLHYSANGPDGQLKVYARRDGYFRTCQKIPSAGSTPWHDQTWGDYINYSYSLDLLMLALDDWPAGDGEDLPSEE